jgi:threonine dehydrogenase-like Zn-dependent dehydrogenase
VVPDEAHEYVGELARLGGGTVAGRGRNTVLMGGYGVVVDAVGSSEVFAQATRFCAQRGTVYAMGALGTVHADLAALYFKELEVVGTLCHAVDQLNGEGEHSFDRALALLAQGKYPADIIVTHDYALADYREALETAQNRKAGAIKVLLHP